MKWSEWRAHQNADGLWYFWDESDAYEIGPYRTKQECVDAMNQYAEELSQPPHPFFSDLLKRTKALFGKNKPQ